MLTLKTHFERVFAVNLGEVVGHLERGTDFVRGQEGVAAQSLQSVDSECGQPTVFVILRYALDAKREQECRVRSLADGETRVVWR